VSTIAPLSCAVRVAQPKDSTAMAALAVQLGYECTAADVRQRLAEMNNPTQYGVFVAVLPEMEIVGWICVYVFRAIEVDTLAEISGLVVDERFRSHGIGKVLIKAAEDWARQAGCADISVHSNVTRERAHRFYVSNGYEPIKTQEMFRKSF